MIIVEDGNETIPNSVILKDLLDLLDEGEKEVIILRFYNNCTIKEVANILNIPMGITKMFLYRAKSSKRMARR